MIDINVLLPEVTKLLPEASQDEIISGIKEFVAAHPEATNEDALQALSDYLGEQTQPQPEAPASNQPRFQGLLNNLGAK